MRTGLLRACGDVSLTPDESPCAILVPAITRTVRVRLQADLVRSGYRLRAEGRFGESRRSLRRRRKAGHYVLPGSEL